MVVTPITTPTTAELLHSSYSNSPNNPNNPKNPSNSNNPNTTIILITLATLIIQLTLGNHFEDVGSIISRHFTLEDAQKDLLLKQKESTVLNEALRNKFTGFKKDQYNSTLSMNNQIHTFSTTLGNNPTTPNDSNDP